MSRFRKLVFIAAIVVVAGVAVSLGRWQLRRLRTRRASNRAELLARAAPPVMLPGLATLADSGRYAVARGQFDTSTRILLRGRVLDEAPGLYVVTPFVLDRGRSVLWVLRGFVPSPDAATPPDVIAAPDSGPVTVHGLLIAAPALADSGSVLHHLGAITWRDLDRSTMHALRPASIDVYLLESDDSAGPGRLPPIAPNPLTDGPHLSYAIQWFGIALAVVAFGVLILWRGDRTLPPEQAAP